MGPQRVTETVVTDIKILLSEAICQAFCQTFREQRFRTLDHRLRKDLF